MEQQSTIPAKWDIADAMGRRGGQVVWQEGHLQGRTILVTGRSQSCVLVLERWCWRCCSGVCGLFGPWVNGMIFRWDWSVMHCGLACLAGKAAVLEGTGWGELVGAMGG